MLLSVLLYFLDFENIGEGFSSIQPKNIYISFGLSIIVLIATSIRWWIFVHAARFPHKFWVSVRVRLIAQFLNLIVPSGVVGDGLQVFLVSRRPRLSGPLALATIIIDRIVALFAVVLVLVLTAGMMGGDTGELVYVTVV